jgi:hypothetical protein
MHGVISMESYMIDRHEKGAFSRMYNHAAETIRRRPPAETAEKANVIYDEAAGEFAFQSFGEPFRVSAETCRARFGGTDDEPLYDWHILMLQYLGLADGVPLSRERILYRDLRGGVAHSGGFEDKTRAELVKRLSYKPPEKLKQACLSLGGVLEKASADVCATFAVMPNFPVTVQIWLSDDEMEGSANILFNARAAHYLSVEGVDHAGTVVTEFLIAQYETMFPKG